MLAQHLQITRCSLNAEIQVQGAWRLAACPARLTYPGLLALPQPHESANPFVLQVGTDSHAFGLGPHEDCKQDPSEPFYQG